MPLHFKIDEYVEFALRVNYMLKDLMFLDKAYSRKKRQRVLRYCKEGENVLWRLKQSLICNSSIGDRLRYYYNINQHANKELFCGFTVADIIDPTSAFLMIGKQFVDEMNKLDAVLKKEKRHLILVQGTLFCRPQKMRTWAGRAHAYGKAVDVNVSDMLPEDGFFYLVELCKKHDIAIALVQFKDYIHIGGNPMLRVIEYDPTRAVCKESSPFIPD